ncbi:DUF4333 domain-containing protein [Rhodococcus sp. X156]|uniref:DUF4333 domain-containing protein n=1 Tax=Rhodococcus sp. X156 TaxID=2499145 RepID=UPI000FDCC1D7|nr:DUF4333 domain-containing protein [Rhodococcus sp. X156]
MSSPHGPNDPPQPPWGGPQQPYQGSYGQPDGSQQQGWGGAPPRPGGPQPGGPPQGPPPQGPPPQAPYRGQPQPPYGPPGQPQGQPGYPGQPPYGAPTQPPAPPQGPPPYGPPTGQLGGAPFVTPPPATTKSRTPLYAGAGLAVVALAVLAVLAFVAPGFAVTKTLSPTAVQDGVQKVLTDTYKTGEVTGVSCPDGQEVKSGNTFTCKATVDGKESDIKVSITDDDGTYQVGRP